MEKVKKPSLDQILAHPVVQAVNPRTRDFVAMRWLSSALNPYQKHGIEIGAAIAFMSNFQHVKMVAAFGMMLHDYVSGAYDGIDTLVVPTSGNTGHGIATLARAFGIEKVTVVMPSDAPEAKMGAVKMIPYARLIIPEGEGSVESVAREEADRPGSYLLDQYSHPGNAQIHMECTGQKLLQALGGWEDNKLGLVAVGMGSGGTVTGVSRFLKTYRRDIIVIGVRPKLGERVPGTRDSEQMKAVVTIPYEDAVDDIVEVERKESFTQARRLILEVYPHVGPSSGLACVGLFKYLERSPDVRELLQGRRAVFFCPDGAQLYPAPTAAELDPGQGLRP
ncbi:MAG TPA: pyridoxal-phosphate dependent enzyme [Candidatus Paceibacterota bacterium]|nr:pyridoxal-phosphate dependent enzyme [Candidatus Paceibacterota bacterium]